MTLTLPLLAMACGGENQSAAAAPPPLGVEAVTLAMHPVERTGEFVGLIRSRRSATVQPQAEGFVTAIRVTSGDRVSPGTVLMQIDAEPQRATVANLESQRAAREADLVFTRQQSERAKVLLAAGAASQQEFDQAAAALKAAEAQLQALDEQIRQQRVELNYYRVTAPTAGVIGDIPVRVGDRVTRSTMLTTIDDHAGFEVYVNVPVQQAPSLQTGLPVRILDERSKIVSTNPITFVAPSVDDATQTVLVKTGLRENVARFRTDQFVRAQIVWAAEPGLTVPIISLSRVNGQFFAYRGRSRRERGDGRPAARRGGRPGRRQRLCGSQRSQGRRPPDRVGDPEGRRRDARPHRRGVGRAIVHQSIPVGSLTRRSG